METLALILIGIALGATAVAVRLRGEVARRLRAEADLAAERSAFQHAREASERLLQGEREARDRQLEELRRATAEKVALVAGGRDEFVKEMRSIAHQTLQGATGELAKLAEQARKADQAVSAGELKARAEEIKQAMAPIAQHLERVQRQVEALDKDRKETQGTVSQMFAATSAELTRLRRETGSLVTALRRPQVRGSWGEMQLRNCAKAANMTANVDFHDQLTVAGDDGRLRPDMTVHLPSDADVVVDSKVPLEAYLAALDATEDDAREAELDRHARQVRTHIDRLAAKSYHAQFDVSPEFVVCFIPNEAIYCAALDRDPGLLEYGAARRVLLATPSTLIALLHACASAWRQEQIAESAKEVADAGRELHKRMATFLEPFSRLGRQLGSAVNAYNESVGSMEGRVLPQLRRIEEAGAGSEKELKEVAPLDTPPRLVTAPEASGRDGGDGAAGELPPPAEAA